MKFMEGFKRVLNFCSTFTCGPHVSSRQKAGLEKVTTVGFPLFIASLIECRYSSRSITFPVESSWKLTTSSKVLLFSVGALSPLSGATVFLLTVNVPLMEMSFLLSTKSTLKSHFPG